MARNRALASARKAFRKSQKARTKKPEKPKKQEERRSKPNKPKTDVASQYKSYRSSSFAKPTQSKAQPKQKQTSLQKAQSAFNRGQKVRASQQKRNVTNTSVTKPKSNVITDLSKPKNYDAKKDLQKAYKKGSTTTTLGTQQKKTTTTLKTKKEQKQEYKQSKTQYYKSQDWKNTKNELKTKNQESWRKALSDQGWNRKEIDDWMNSDEGKKYRRESYMEMKDATKKSINKSIAKGIKDTSKLESVNALTKSQFSRMADASKYGKKNGNKLLKGSERMGTDDIREIVGSKTAESAYKSKLATGVMQGMSKADVFSGSVGKYNKGAKEAIEQTKHSGAYMAGYGLGLAADMAMGGVASRGASLAEGAGKGASKVVSKLAGKGAYKEVTKEAAKEATEEVAKVTAKQGAKRFAKNRAGELAAETPTNILDAAKMSLDTDGKLDKKEFKKWLAINSAFTFGVGGAMEGIGAGATKKLANETIELQSKKLAGKATEEELEKLEKNVEKLSQKTKGDIKSISSDIAEARMGTINKRNAQAAKATAESIINDASKVGRKQGIKKGKFSYEGAQSRYNYAQKLSENKERIRDRARRPEKAWTEAEQNARKQSAKKHADNATRSAERARNKEVRRIQDEIRTLREQYGEAEARANKKENTIEGHAKAQEDLKRIQEEITRKENQLRHASDDTLSGRIGKSEKELARDNTLEGHARAVKRREKLDAELKADSEAVAKERKVEQALREARKKAEANPTPENRAKVAVAEEALEKAKASNKPKTLEDRYKEAGLPDYVAQRSPAENREFIAETEESIKRFEKYLKEAQTNQRRAFANGDTKLGYKYAEQYNELKAGLADARETLDEFRKADEIATEYGAFETKAETKAVEPEGGFAKLDESELDRVNLAKPKQEQGIELKPKEGESTYQAHKETLDSEKQKENHRKDLANKEKATKETKNLKSAWKKFYSMFVSELEPWERMAMSAATKELRKRGRVTINGLLTARSKAMTKIREEGMKIFESRGLHKDMEKAKAYDDYALFMHDMDRLKQKSIDVFKGDTHYSIDFGEGAIYELKQGGYKKIGDLPPNNYRKMSEEDIRKDIEKYVKENDYDWDGIINSKSFTGYSEKTLKDLINDLEKQYGKDIKDFQRELVAYHKDLLKEDTRGGIISVQRYKKLLRKYPNYVPTFRDYDAISARSFNEDFHAVNLYAAKGAENANDIIPQYTQMISKTNAVMKRTAENEMLNVISKINNIPVKDLPHGHTPDELIEVSSGVYKTTSGQHMIYFRQNGKGVSMEIGEEAYHAIRQWSGAERAAIMEFKLMDRKAVKAGAKALTEGSRAFKALITDYSIIFGCRNFVRDSATALVYSEHPAQWLVNFPKAVMAMKKGTKYHAALEQYIKDGGRYNALVTSTDLSKMPKLGKKEGIPGLRLIKDFNTTMETLPRMSEYISTIERMAKKDGMTFEQALKKRGITQEAMYNAKEVTLNFDRAGQYGRMLNRGFVPFFNPSVQGIDKLARFLVKDNKSMAEFMSMGAKMAGMVIAPTVAWEYFVNQSTHPGTGDEGMGEAYRKLSAYNKYAYFCIPMGKDENGDWEFLKIPRAREMAAMQMPIDWFVQNVMYQNRDGTANLFESMKQAGRLSIEQIGPVNPLTDNYFSPMWNLAHNKNWMGGRIEGYEDEDKRKLGRASDIYDSDTSSAAVTIMSLVNAKQNETLKKLGLNPDVTRWIKQHQVSPKQLDNLFDSYMGVIYDMGIRPFSQQGASLKSVKEKPGEEAKQWLDTTFGTAFVVNGTLSSQRKSGMYANLYDLEDKLKDYPKGSKDYGEANAKLKEFQNNCVYDVQSLDTAIDAINRSKKYTGREKAELTKAIKREQNLMIDDYNNGKKTVHDPLKAMMNLKDKNGKRVFSDDYVFNNLTFTTDKGQNTIKSSWSALKNSDYYKEHPKKATKDFKDVTFGVREMAGKMSDSKSFMDYSSIAIFCEDKKATKGKDYSGVLDAYGIKDSNRKLADVYINQMGGSADTYVASHGRLVKGAHKLGYDYVSDLPSHTCTMILAESQTKNGNKLKDRAYWVEQNKYGNNSYAYERMNYARCLESDKYAGSKWSSKKVDRFAAKYGLSYNSPDDDIVNAINDKYPNKTDEEKAALFGVIKPTDENPFGEVGDYGVDGDSGYESGRKGRGRGRRRGRRRGGGGGGGSRGTPYVPLINTAGEHSKVTDTSTKNTSKKSNLDDAYRKHLKKLREQTKK